MTERPSGSEPPASEDAPESGPEAEISIRRIQILNLGVLAVFFGAGFLVSVRFALGVLAGGVLMAANFRVIAGVVRSVLLDQTSGVLNAGFYWVKFLALIGLIGALVLWFRVDVFGCLLGLSTILVAITLEAVLRLSGR